VASPPQLSAVPGWQGECAQGPAYWQQLGFCAQTAATQESASLQAVDMGAPTAHLS